MKQTNFPAWLRAAVFYQVYPQSFCDSNGDGIGDLPGLISKLDYIRSLGCNAVWMSPCFESPFGDAGYDVGDFRKVGPALRHERRHEAPLSCGRGGGQSEHMSRKGIDGQLRRAWDVPHGPASANTIRGGGLSSHVPGRPPPRARFLYKTPATAPRILRKELLICSD